MMDMSNNLSFFLIDRLSRAALGGNLALNRDFTQIQLAIMQDIYLKISDLAIRN